MRLHVDTAGGGRDLVLLHGWGLHSGAWDELVPALAARVRVHAIDLPGHGHSAAVPAGSFDDTVEGLAAHVPKGSSVCGWSLGGLLALALAHRFPDRVSRLALVATSPCFVERPGWRNGMKAATLEGFAGALREDRDAMLKRFVALNAMNGAHGREAVRAFTARLQQRGAPSSEALAATLGWLRDVDLRDVVPALAARDLVIVHGSRDMIASVKAARWMSGQLPRSALHVFEDGAHMPFFSHRAAFLSAVEPLLA
jgi:pimeloyl-[acyl-carrier protein] methyl ester esterase